MFSALTWCLRCTLYICVYAVLNVDIYNYIKEITDFAIACWIFDWILMKTDAEMIGTGTVHMLAVAVECRIYWSLEYIRCNAITYASWAQAHTETHTVILISLSIQCFVVHKTSIWEWVRLCCLVALWNDDVRRLLSNLNAKQQQQQWQIKKNSMEISIQRKKFNDKLKRKPNPLLWHFETVLFFVSFFH